MTMLFTIRVSHVTKESVKVTVEQVGQEPIHQSLHSKHLPDIKSMYFTSSSHAKEGEGWVISDIQHLAKDSLTCSIQ